MAFFEREALQLIADNISKFGCHVYTVKAGLAPRYAYTIGLRESMGVELVLAGAIAFLYNDVKRVVAEFARASHARTPDDPPLVVEGLGSFTLRKVHPSWSRLLLIGANEYFQSEVCALQIVPDADHWTADVPDLSVAWDSRAEPVWQWLVDPWKHPAPEASDVITNLAALRGGVITEVARWEEGYWEMFVGPQGDVAEGDARVVHLGTLLASDPTLEAALSLPIGGGLKRDRKDGKWRAWGSATLKQN